MNMDFLKSKTNSINNTNNLSPMVIWCTSGCMDSCTGGCYNGCSSGCYGSCIVGCAQDMCGS
jgi:hypothetical protein